ncbi:BPI fold-containing family B member 2 isoform X2 [Numida meleagris]|uniref:BPI fold-containing family B member 2 isoform X2 n=1 Tax=Numida meleagris TaxID=8996 RepID=UPI000B3DA81F|nr:BPI fold-containing family B member 2 isoform X2 [Numida meleagris]
MGEANRKGSAMPLLCTLGALLALLDPVQTTRAPDCGGILTPLGLSYLAEISKPHAEVALRWDLMALRASDLFLGSTDPSRDRITSVKVVDLQLTLIPEAELRLGIEVELGIAPLLAVPKPARLSIQADLHVDLGPDGNLRLLTSACRPTVRAQSTRKEESKSSRSILDKEVDVDKLCLGVSKLLLFPNEQLVSLTAPFPVTPSCQLQYLPLAAPVFSKQGIALSLQTSFQVAGEAVPVPVSPVPFSMPELVSTSNSHLILAFSEHFYTSLYFTLERAGAFNMTIPSMLTTTTLAQKIPQVGSLYPEDLPIMLSAALRSSPRVVLEEGRAALKLFLSVHIGAGSPDVQSFLSVSADVTAGLQLSVSDTRMMISTAVIEDAELSLAASDVGLVPVGSSSTPRKWSMSRPPNYAALSPAILSHLAPRAPGLGQPQPLPSPFGTDSSLFLPAGCTAGGAVPGPRLPAGAGVDGRCAEGRRTPAAPVPLHLHRRQRCDPQGLRPGPMQPEAAEHHGLNLPQHLGESSGRLLRFVDFHRAKREESYFFSKATLSHI